MNVKVKDLIRVYRLGSVEVQALRGLSMDVDAGEMVSIIGPSGSGKTTLLNVVGGLDQATGGHVQVGDVAVTALNQSQLVDYRRKTVGHVFQTLNLIPTLTAAENIELPMMAMGTAKGIRVKRVQELLNVVGLTDRADHKPEELSGGEQQRVAIARALAQEPEMLLLDEPTASLDWRAQREIMELVKKIHEEHKLTTLFVTHDLNALPDRCDRVILMKAGTIWRQGKSEEMLKQDILSQLYDAPITVREHEGRQVFIKAA